MADSDSWDVDNFEPPEPPKATAVPDKWEGEDEEDDVKDNWDDEDDGEKKEEEEEVKIVEKKKVAEKVKEKTRKKKDETKETEEPEPKELTAEEQIAEKLRIKKIQEDADLELAKEAFGESVSGIDAMNPSTRDEFIEFGRVLKEKILQYEKSVHYTSFLETLVRDICISLEVEELKKVCSSMTVLCNEKQKQEKQSKAKKKKKATLAGGVKASMKDTLADYLDYDGEFAQEYEDFM